MLQSLEFEHQKSRSTTPLRAAPRVVRIAGFLLALFALPVFAIADDHPVSLYRIEAQDLDGALRAFAFQSRREIFFAPDMIHGKQSHGVSGKYDDVQALDKILRDTGLTYSITASDAILLKDPSVALRAISLQVFGTAVGNGDQREQGSSPAPYTGGAQNAERNSESSQANPRASSELDEVIVTARKRNETVLDTPASISVFTSKVLAAQGTVQLEKDLDKVALGMTITNYGAGNIAEATPFIRGIGTQDHLLLTDPGVGVYLDGVYLGRATGNNMSLANIEQIEILRGPQGTLSGRNTLGGAINIVTREPDQNDAAEISGVFGSRNRANGNFYGNMPVTDELAISITGSTEHRAGIGHFVNLDTQTEVGQIDQQSGRVALKWMPTDRFSLLLAADGSNGNYGLAPMYDVVINPSGFFRVTQGIFPKNRDDNGTINPDIPDTNSKSAGVSLTGKYTFDQNLSLKVIGSERYSSYKAGLADVDAPVHDSEFPERGWARQYTGEATLNGEYTRADFVTGLYYFHEDGQVGGPPYYYLGSRGVTQVEQTTASYAGFVHGGYHITDALKVSGGVRFTSDHKEDGAYILCCLNPGVERSKTWTAPTWDIAIDYTLQA